MFRALSDRSEVQVVTVVVVVVVVQWRERVQYRGLKSRE
jgi:hypothetical protein